MAGSRAQKRRRNRRNQRKTTPVHRHDVVSGTHFKPPNNIRSVTARPWNNLSVQASFAHQTDKNITFADILQRIVLNNGLYIDSTANALPVECKLVSAEIYGMTDQTITVIFYELTEPSTPNSSWEQTQQCFPARNQYARVGFVWPLSDQSRVIRTNSQATYKVLTVRGSGANDTFLIKFRVLWRSNSYSAALEQPNVRSTKTVSPDSSTAAQLATTTENVARLEATVNQLCSLLSAKIVLTDP